MTIGFHRATTAPMTSAYSAGWMTPGADDEHTAPHHGPSYPRTSHLPLQHDDAPAPADPDPAEPAPDTPADPPTDTPHRRNRALATLDSMGRSSGAAFTDSAYFTGLFERTGVENQGAIKPDWQTIGIAGGTVAGVGGLYGLAKVLPEISSARAAGAAVAQGAARAVGGLGTLALFATPILAAGVAAPALADLAHLGAPNLIKQHHDVSEATDLKDRHRIEDDNTMSTIGRAAAGAVLVGGLAFAGLMLNKAPIPGLVGKFFPPGINGALRGAATLGLVGGVSASAFYNVFDKNEDIVRTHSPLRSY